MHFHKEFRGDFPALRLLSLSVSLRAYVMETHAISHCSGMPKRHFCWSLWLYDAPRHWVSQNEKQNWDAHGKGSGAGVSGRLRACLCEEPSRWGAEYKTAWLAGMKFHHRNVYRHKLQASGKSFLYNFPAKCSRWGWHQQLRTQVRTKPTPSSSIIPFPCGFCWNHLVFHSSLVLSTVVTAEKT